MTIATTTATEIRRRLARFVQRIRPRYTQEASQRWVWRDAQEITGRLRNFDIVMQPEAEVPGGAYGTGIRYSTETSITVAYPLDEEIARRAVGADGQDLAALLAQLHELVDEEGTIDGMFPINMAASRGLPMLIPRFTQDDEGAFVVEFRVEIHFMAHDLVDLDPL